jgi:hypothetical protein
MWALWLAPPLEPPSFLVIISVNKSFAVFRTALAEVIVSPPSEKHGSTVNSIYLASDSGYWLISVWISTPSEYNS